MIKKILIIGIGFMFFGCEKIWMDDRMENTPEQNFQLLWQTLDQKYSFFVYRNINWDSIYSVYHPFVKNKMSDNELFTLFSLMLEELEDGHVNIQSPFAQSIGISWEKGIQSNFNKEILFKNYFKNSYETTGPFISQEIHSIGYIYYGSFNPEIDDDDINYVISKFNKSKGIIFDVRNNGGGNTTNVHKIVSRFTNKKFLAELVYYKNGPGHNDFTSGKEVYLIPKDTNAFLKPVVILTNRNTYSAANNFVLFMKNLPQVTILGDTTGGGGGIPIYAELLNGWIYRFPTSYSTDLSNFNVENGIPPDVIVREALNYNKNKDIQFESALKYILENKYQSENKEHLKYGFSGANINFASNPPICQMDSDLFN